jgi:ribosomal protein L37AE/L43A
MPESAKDDGGLDQTMRTDDCRFCEGTTEARTVDYYGNTVWACKNCEALL